jgi:DNA polymerase-3 subunit alpha
MVYQEQVMRITNVLAGFTLDEADSLRKAMSKKKPEEMAKYRQKFVDGASERGCDKDVATTIWEQMEFFAGYGFNKSHSTAYGLVTWWTAWLKANHPLEFWAAVITCDSANSDKVAAYLGECRRAGIEVLPPDLFRSELSCTTDGVSVRLGLGNVKGIGPKAIEEMLAARATVERAAQVARGATASAGGATPRAGGATNGPAPTPDLAALLEHVNPQSVNRAALEALVHSGALDATGQTRAALAAALDALLQESAAAQRDKKAGQKQLFGMAAGGAKPVARNRIAAVPEWPEREKLRLEKEALGFYVSANPLARYSDLLLRHCTARVEDLQDVPDGATVTVGGITGKARITVAKRGRMAGRKMAIVEVAGLAGAVTVVVFPETYEKTRDFLDEDRIVLITGQLDLSSERPTIKANDVRPLDGALSGAAGGQLVLDLPAREDVDLRGMLGRVRSILSRHKGASPVFFRVHEPGRPPSIHRTSDDHFVAISVDLVEALEQELGPGCASLR